MKRLIIFIVILSVIDAVATAAGIKLNYIREVNPVIGDIVMKYPTEAGVSACILTVVLLLLIYRYRYRVSWIRHALVMVLLVKSLVVCLHLIVLAHVIKAWVFLLVGISGIKT